MTHITVIAMEVLALGEDHDKSPAGFASWTRACDWTHGEWWELVNFPELRDIMDGKRPMNITCSMCLVLLDACLSLPNEEEPE